MPPTVNSNLASLEKSLEQLQAKHEPRAQSLREKLKLKEKLSPEDEEWLDGPANFSDEKLVLDVLQSFDGTYDAAVASLSGTQKIAYENMLVGPGKARKEKINRDYSSARKRTADDDNIATVPQKLARKEPAAVFTKKEVAMYKQRVEILDWHHSNGVNQSKTASQFHTKYPNLRIKQPLVSSWIRQEAEIRQKFTEDSALGTFKRTQQTTYPEVTEALELWIAKAMNADLFLTGKILRQKWVIFADLAGIPEASRLSLTNGWLESLKKRNNLQLSHRHGEAGSADPKTVAEERERMQKITAEYNLEDIYNGDETALYYGMPPDRGLSNKAQSGVKGNKVCLTYLFVANATGTDKRPPLIIGKAKKPRAFKGKNSSQLGFNYWNNAKAWMTGLIYHWFLSDWDDDLCKENRKILYLHDNFSGHTSVPTDHLTNIRIELFEPNLTPHVQPMDAGIIAAFKFISRALNQHDGGITRADIYNINQLEGMRLAEVAWERITAKTIRNCFTKAGIITAPITVATSTSVVLTHVEADDGRNAAEGELEELNRLQSRGLLHKDNHMTLDELIHPETKAITGFVDISDADIFSAVIEARQMDLEDCDDSNDPEPALAPGAEKSLPQSTSSGHTQKEQIADFSGKLKLC
ncbi:DDE-domain-containing protein [Athelia psychrophila]|uniref:DDE-domain-containing protein n=1 Tax=Athelia psychrophila TaxID=1759441 RepID=A0A166KPT6_9AGAM|nr:DDE-domain-containing protein [Fibularhizoctonia sp. CBS 109695]